MKCDLKTSETYSVEGFADFSHLSAFNVANVLLFPLFRGEIFGTRVVSGLQRPALEA